MHVTNTESVLLSGFLCDPKVHHHLHKTSSLKPVFRHFNAVYILTLYFSEIQFNIIPTPKPASPLSATSKFMRPPLCHIWQVNIKREAPGYVDVWEIGGTGPPIPNLGTKCR
jgi:hypothetical protein